MGNGRQVVMGGENTFIEGVGDEVVLFVGFLALSVTFLIFVGLWKSGNREEAPQRQREGRISEEAGVAASAVRSTNRTQSEGLLRHRTTAHSSSTPPTPSVVEETRARHAYVEHENIEQSTSSDEHEDPNSSFSMRLIIAGRPDHPKEIVVTPTTTVDQLRQTHFQNELSQNCPVRFIYQGRLISDDTVTIGSLGIANGGAMHVHIGRPRPPDQPPPAPPMQQLDLSRFFLPLLGLILGIVWMAMLSYPYVFSFITKVFLFTLSFGYVVLTYFSTIGSGTGTEGLRN